MLGGLRALLGAKAVSAKALVAGELLHEIAERGGEAAASLSSRIVNPGLIIVISK